MTLNELQQIYTTGFFQQEKTTSTEYVILPIDHGWFHIPCENLTKTEIKLLKTYFNQNKTNTDLISHPWYNYLFANGTLPHSTDSCRIIQIHLKKESPLKDDWLTHFTNLFNQVEDAFFINSTTAILIEKQNSMSSNIDDIKAMLLTLEGDFMVQATIFLGAFHELSPRFIDFFQEENQLGLTYAKHFHVNDVFNFQHIALNYLTQETIAKSSIMTDIKASLQLDEEFIQIIHTLWEEQGNITSTSKKLYIHRNTLQYRLDKFYERTGLSLKNMNDLTLCYLVSL